MATPPPLPRWAVTTGGVPASNLALPTSAKRDAGWADQEQPPAGIFNELQYENYNFVQFLDNTSGSYVFGDGSDGPLLFDGTNAVVGFSRSSSTYTALRDIFATNATLSAGVTVKSAGFRIYGTGLLDMSALNCKISNDGNAAVADAGGVALGGIVSTLYAGASGGAPAGSGSTATNATNALGGAGGLAGDGTGGAAGGGGTVTAPVATSGSIHVPTSLVTGLLMGISGITVVQGGAGGGGGGGAAAINKGGGGGGPGGVLIVIFKQLKLVASSLFTANGGAGANGPGAGSGGGGGGGGGCVILAYQSLASGSLDPVIAGLIAANSGSGGTASGGGSAGGNGAVGNVIVSRP